MSTTIYISIGNSDDKLSQAEWSRFVLSVAAEVTSYGQLHGAWFSPPQSPWQNACWCVELDDDEVAKVKEITRDLAQEYRQDSIAWAVAETELLTPWKGATA